MKKWIPLWLGVSILAGLRPPAQASFIQAPHLGARDGGMAGNVVATPGDGISTLLFNPAGVVGTDATNVTSSLMGSPVGGRYSNSQTGYDQKTDELPLGPAFWVGTNRLAPWYVGAGMYGMVGASFNFAAQPSVGAPGQYSSQFLGDMGLMQMGLVVGREIMPGLRFGAQVSPTWGRMRTRMPSPLGEVYFDINGFGIAGMFGLLYDLTNETTLGLTYRTPGVVYMRGDGAVGGHGNDVDLNMHLPQSIIFGLAYHATPKLTLTAQSTWTDYPNMEEGVFKFQQFPMLNSKFISSARSTFRSGAGMEYAWEDWLWLRAGLTVEPWMMEASSLSPLMYDSNDYMLMIGLGIVKGQWQFDINTGYAYTDDRLVAPSDQPYYPGRYELDAPVGVTIGVTYRFGGEAT